MRSTECSKKTAHSHNIPGDDLDIFDFLRRRQKEHELTEVVSTLTEALRQRDATIRALIEKVRENREAIQLLADAQSVLNQNQHVLAAEQLSSASPVAYRPFLGDDTWN